MPLNPNGKKIARCPFCKSNNILFLSDVDHDHKYCLVGYDSKNNKIEDGIFLPVNVYGCKDCSYVFMNIETLTIKD